MPRTESSPTKFGKWLSKIRQEHGITARALAEQAGLTGTTVTNIESGRTQHPSDDTCLNIKEAVAFLISGGVGEFGQWLRNAREKSDLNPSELAEKVGISTQTIYNIENGRTQNPNTATRSKIESALKTKIPNKTIKSAQESQVIELLGSIEDFDPYAQNLIPDYEGVYVIYDIVDRPTYVGMSKNIRSRIAQHKKEEWFIKPFVQSAACIKVTEDVLRRQIEKLLIKFLKSQAIVNKVHVSRLNREEL